MDNTAETQAERAYYAQKFFDYTETPIKEWLAGFVETDVTQIFPDYVDKAEIIAFADKGQHYKAYVVPMPPDTNVLIPSGLLENNPNARKACSILFDAVREVFLAITGSIEDAKHEYLKGFMPYFDETKMAFRLKRVNRKAMQLQAANNQRKQLDQFLSANDYKAMTEEQKNLIHENISKLNEIFNLITKETMDEEEKLCEESNKKTEVYDRLYMVIEELDPDDSELENESLKRLPNFGLQYQDPEEDTYIDKLKKEYDVNE